MIDNRVNTYVSDLIFQAKSNQSNFNIHIIIYKG